MDNDLKGYKHYEVLLFVPYKAHNQQAVEKKNSGTRFINNIRTSYDPWLRPAYQHTLITEKERKKERKRESVISKPFKIQQNRMI